LFVGFSILMALRNQTYKNQIRSYPQYFLKKTLRIDIVHY
jgi:hypothetical protein